jgi:hypothetical protein
MPLFEYMHYPLRTTCENSFFWSVPKTLIRRREVFASGGREEKNPEKTVVPGETLTNSKNSRSQNFDTQPFLRRLLCFFLMINVDHGS